MKTTIGLALALLGAGTLAQTTRPAIAVPT